MAGTELHGKRAQSTHDEASAPPHIGMIDGKPQVREPFQQGRQGDLPFQAGQRRPRQ